MIETVESETLARWSSILLEGRYECSKVFQDVSPERFLPLAELQARADGLNRAVWRTMGQALSLVWDNQGSYYLWPGYVVRDGERLDEVDPRTADGAALPGAAPAQYPPAFGTDLTKGGDFRETPLSVWMDLFYGQVVDGLRLRGFTEYISKIRRGKPGPLKTNANDLVHCLELSTTWNGVNFNAGIFRIGLMGAKAPTELLERVQSAMKDSFESPYRFPPISAQNGMPVSATAAAVLEPIFEELLWSVFYGYERSGHRLGRHRSRLEAYGAADAVQRLDRAILRLDHFDSSRSFAAFTHYYVIPLETSLGPGKTGHAVDLGTINIYTTKPLPTAFVHLLKPWLQAMYAQLRLLEIFDHAVSRAVRRERRTQAHELVELIKGVEERSKQLPELRDLSRAFLLVLGMTTDSVRQPRTLRDIVDGAIEVADLVASAVGGNPTPIGVLSSVLPTPLWNSEAEGWKLYILGLASAIRNARKHTTGPVQIVFDGHIVIINPGQPNPSRRDKNHPGSTEEAVHYFLAESQSSLRLDVPPALKVEYFESRGEWHSRLTFPMKGA